MAEATTVGLEVQSAGPRPEAQAVTSSTQTTDVKEQQRARMEEGRRGIEELGKNGINLGEDNGKTPDQIIDSIPGWQNDSTTQRYVGEAQQLYREVEAAKKVIRDNLQKSGDQFSEEAITAEAERIVLENRIEAATPEGQNRVLEVQGEAIQQWVQNGALGEEAKPLLVYLASDEAVRTAEKRVRDLSKAASHAKTEKEQKSIVAEQERAQKILKETRAAFEKAMKENDKLKTDPHASDVVRLLAYDIDARQTTIELNENVGIRDYISRTPEEERDRETQARMEEVEAKIESLKNKQEILKGERSKIGTPEQQQIDYVAAEVIRLTGDVSEIKNKDGSNISKEEQEKREVLRKVDPIRYLQSEIDRVGIENILANSDVSPEDQKKLIALATTKEATRTVKGKEALDKSRDVGKTGIMALLLLLYTAYGANKKSKGQQMG